MSLFAWLFLVTEPNRGNEPRPAPPAATESSDETVVTARKHSERLADLPLSVSAVDARELEDFRIVEVSDLVSRVPNLTFSEFSSRRLSFPFVRGVGSGSGDPSVITYVDDVPQFGFGGTNLPLFDLERIEVLRGPQGTLYGRNALGGLIHLHGRRPTDERRIDLGATLGSDDLKEYSGAYSGSFGGPLRGDVAVLSSERDGFTTNDFTGNEVDSRDGFFGRGRILWNPSADSELDFSMFGERARDGGFVISDLDGLRANPHHINQDFEGHVDRNVLQPGVVYRMAGEELDFTSVSSWQSWEVTELTDFDFSPIDGIRRLTDESQDYYYQELRLGTENAERGRAGGERTSDMRWLVGASGFLSDAENQNKTNFRPGGAGIFFPPAAVGVDLRNGEFDDFGVALFGELGVPLGERFELGAGLRYDHEDKEVERVQTFDPGIGPIPVAASEDDRTDDEIAPMASVSFFPREHALVYLRAAQGWKAGGFNLSGPVSEFEPETLWTYELGWRQSFAEQRHSLGAAVFYNQWEDMQLAQFDGLTGSGFVDNVGEADGFGLELEGATELGEGLTAFATFGFLSTEFDEGSDVFGDVTNNELPFAPDNTWSVGMQYGGEMPSGALWALTGDYGRVGDFFYDAGNREGDEFGLANLRLGVDSESYGVSVWVRNAFDEEYEPVAFQPSPVDPTIFVGESGAPRVLGFTLSLHL